VTIDGLAESASSDEIQEALAKLGELGLSLTEDQTADPVDLDIDSLRSELSTARAELAALEVEQQPQYQKVPEFAAFSNHHRLAQSIAIPTQTPDDELPTALEESTGDPDGHPVQPEPSASAVLDFFSNAAEFLGFDEIGPLEALPDTTDTLAHYAASYHRWKDDGLVEEEVCLWEVLSALYVDVAAPGGHQNHMHLLFWIDLLLAECCANQDLLQVTEGLIASELERCPDLTFLRPLVAQLVLQCDDTTQSQNDRVATCRQLQSLLDQLCERILVRLGL